MRRAQGLLRGGLLRLSQHPSALVPAPFRDGAPTLNFTLPIVSLISTLSQQQPVPLPARAPGPPKQTSPLGALDLFATFSRFLQTSSAACSADGGDKSAAVRRLAAARARREKAAEAAEARRGVVPAADSELQEQAPERDVVPAATTTITPVEGKASPAQIAAALDHQALIVTRPIEWGTVIFGYEQANRYTVYDETGTIVALVAEDYGGLRKEFGRQFLRTRRSFTATVFSADGSQVLFRLRRPAYLITSTMFVEDGEGNTVGEIHRRWHLLRRNYDLYINKTQFAAITGNFLAWEFSLQDATGSTLALVDRNFQGFAKTLFTDAGKYVIHFGSRHSETPRGGTEADGQQQQLLPPVPEQQQQQALPHAIGSQAAPGAVTPPSGAAVVEGAPPAQSPTHQAQQPAVHGTVTTAPVPTAAAAAGGFETSSPSVGAPSVTAMAQFRTGAPVVQSSSGSQLVVARPLDLSERMVALACALSIDYDFFSVHSNRDGGLLMPVIIPPIGGGGSQPPAPPAGTDTVPGAAATGAAAGTVDEAARGASGAGSEDAGFGAGGFGGDDGGRGGMGGSGAGGEDGFDSGTSWGQPGSGDGEMKWDLPSDGGGGDGGGEGGGVVGSVLGALWGLFGGD